MRRVMMATLIMTFLVYTVISLNIPIFRDIIVFIYLSFVPGFGLLKLLKLKKISFLDIILFSVGLSIAFSMFMGLLVNELYSVLGLSQPLSVIPLIVAIFASTLTIFFLGYRHDLPETLNSCGSIRGELKDVFPVYLLLVLLPLLSIVGILYVSIPLMLLSYVIIAVLCIMSVASKRWVPVNLFPFLIFSISLALLCQVLLTSKHIVGFDANLEYYVFRLTQINGHWSFLNADINPVLTLTYNSMLSITLLPAVYSVLMNTQGEIVFKILYPFIFSLIPLILYRIYEKQTGKLIGLLSTLFFIFTSTAFYGVEPLSLNRQIVGELFFLFSIFLLLDKTMPTTKRRLLLIIFGFALIVSHYSLAYLYLAYVALIFIISRIKPEFDDVLDVATVLLLFVMAFSWYTFGSSSPLTSLANTIKLAFFELTTGRLGGGPVGGQPMTAVTMFSLPQVFTVASWINLALSGIVNLFLIIGVLAVILRPKRTGFSAQYMVMSIIAAIIMAASFIAPSIATILNFTRLYAVTLLFLSPCFVLGGKTLLETIRNAWTKIKQYLKGRRDLKSIHGNGALLLIAVLLSVYFLSQSGFINRVTGGAIHAYSIDFDRMKTSNDRQVEISFYDAYIPEQDVFSAVWLSKNEGAPATVYADAVSGTHVLISYGLIPKQLILPLTNTTIPEQGSFIYLGHLNIVSGIITTNTVIFNSSEISSLLNESDLIYSNGNSEIWRAPPFG
jgi:uncharacterized membrane protein